jgi:hypothetical protein
LRHCGKGKYWNWQIVILCMRQWMEKPCLLFPRWSKLLLDIAQLSQPGSQTSNASCPLSQLIARTNFHCQGQDCCHRTAWSQPASNMGYIHKIRGIWATFYARSAVRKGKRTVFDVFTKFWNYNMHPWVCESWLARGISCRSGICYHS